MQWKSTKLLQTLGYTNQQVADYCEVSLGMIKQVKRGSRKPSDDLATKIEQFVRMKLSLIEQMLEHGDGEPLEPTTPAH